MLQAANMHWPLFNLLVPEAGNNDCQNLPFPLQMKPAKVS